MAEDSTTESGSTDMEQQQPQLQVDEAVPVTPSVDDEPPTKKVKVKKQKKAEPSDDLPRCAYVLPKKNRKCRMLVKPNKLYCGEHAMHESGNADRIPCPNDPKHTILKTQLDEHLKKCNSRVTEQPWIVEGLNSVVGETKWFDKIDRRPTHEELMNIVGKISACYDKISNGIEEEQLYQDIIEEHLKDCTSRGQSIAEKNERHYRQQASIIGHMQKARLLENTDKTCVFELGAGKAQLAYWMAKVAPHARFLLVDRTGSRNKYDNLALKENPALKMTRLRCSIEHLDLSKVDAIQGSSSLCGVCKHFCGSATDAGIRCLWNGVDHGLRLDGVVLVPCCLHKTRFKEYVGHVFLEAHKMNTEGDFAALRHVATWATAGLDKVAEGEAGREEEEGEHAPNEQQQAGNNLAINIVPGDENVPWSRLWQKRLGEKAKLVMEYGRVEHLRTLGMEVRLIKYVPTTLTPENLLILGLRKREGGENVSC